MIMGARTAAGKPVCADYPLDEITHEGRFDLVVSDVVMPGLTGLQAVRAARSEGSSTPVILVTGLVGDEVEREAQPLRDVHLLRKPLHVADLRAMAEDLLARAA